MEQIRIAEIGIEGGGITIYGSQSEDGWRFWSEGSSMYLDDNDDEAWRSWSSDPVSSLDLVLPKDWPIFHPTEIYPDFVDWFRTNYDSARESMPEDQRRHQEKHRHGHWMLVLDKPT